MKTYFFYTALCLLISYNAPCQVIHFVFTSDVHYGITRPHFRGKDSVRASVVNDAEVNAINGIVKEKFPADDGIEAGKAVAYIDDIVITGDIANRQEPPVQSAGASWKEFLHDYKNGIKTQDAGGKQTGLFLVPGNHDASDAIGFTKTLQPVHDASSMAGIYTLMSGKTISPEEYNYQKDKINFTRTLGSLHLFFLNIWPDSANRIWMEAQLSHIPGNEPVLIFAHDPPDGDPKHFTNPNGQHDINATDKFENLLEEVYKDTDVKSTEAEQKGWTGFLQKHPNIKAYFHGHNNYSEMYTYTGPHKEVSLPVFRADSPMKGRFSQPDETRLSFDLVSIDLALHKMTVRECFWNKDGGKTLSWGEQRTINL